jgi:hypothetical protein
MQLLLKDCRGVTIDERPIDLGQAIIIGRWVAVWAIIVGLAKLNEKEDGSLSFWLASYFSLRTLCLAIQMAVKRGPTDYHGRYNEAFPIDEKSPKVSGKRVRTRVKS